MAKLHILKNTETEAVVKVYTDNSAGETINISLENDLTKSTQEYVTGVANIDEQTNGDFATYTGSHAIITGIWWGAKDGKRVDIERITDPVGPVYHNHYYLIGAGYYDFKASGFADRIYAHKDIAVKFQGGEGHCILRLTKQGWANKVETAQFSIYDDVNTVGS